MRVPKNPAATAAANEMARVQRFVIVLVRIISRAGGPGKPPAGNEQLRCSNLLQEGCDINVDTTPCDPPPCGIVFVNRATGHFDRRARCGSTGKRPEVFSLKAPLNYYDTLAEDQVLRNVAVARKSGNERADELVLYRVFSGHRVTREHENHIVRVIAHDAVYIRSLPDAEVFGHERLNISLIRDCSRSSHVPCLLESDDYIQKL